MNVQLRCSSCNLFVSDYQLMCYTYRFECFLSKCIFNAVVSWDDLGARGGLVFALWNRYDGWTDEWKDKRLPERGDDREMTESTLMCESSGWLKKWVDG